MKKLLNPLGTGLFSLAAVLLVLGMLAVPMQYSFAEPVPVPDAGTCQPSTSDDCPNYTSSTDCLAFRRCSKDALNCICLGEVDPITLKFSCFCP
jgi:hypothetical protein